MTIIVSVDYIRIIKLYDPYMFHVRFVFFYYHCVYFKFNAPIIISKLRMKSNV